MTKTPILDYKEKAKKLDNRFIKIKVLSPTCPRII